MIDPIDEMGWWMRGWICCTRSLSGTVGLGIGSRSAASIAVTVVASTPRPCSHACVQVWAVGCERPVQRKGRRGAGSIGEEFANEPISAVYHSSRAL